MNMEKPPLALDAFENAEYASELEQARKEYQDLNYAAGWPRRGETIVRRRTEAGQSVGESAESPQESWTVEWVGAKYIVAEGKDRETGNPMTKLIPITEAAHWDWTSKNYVRVFSTDRKEMNRKLGELRQQILGGEHSDLPPPVGSRIRVARTGKPPEDGWRVMIVKEDTQDIFVAKDNGGGEILRKWISFGDYFNENMKNVIN